MGVRMGSSKPKQFLEVAGKPLVIHTLEKFLKIEWDKILVSLPKAWLEASKPLLEEFFPGNSIQLVAGGETRRDSVWNCLEILKDFDQKGIVCIHDGVRPIVSHNLINSSLVTAKKIGSAIPAINPVDTIRLGPESETSIVNRDQVFLVQTPQSFHLDRIIEAYENIDGPGFTDDAGIYEKRFGQIKIISGEPDNIKITTATDLLLAELLLKD